ncbi:hypothetical protein HDU97_005321 [Phlyctochytrium planicorne]|nr:hypothetical protein HDU97_005321 [Phlyctochytrium planicorne]
MRSYLVDRKPPLQRRWWWSKWWRGLGNWKSGKGEGGTRGGGGLGGWGTSWGGSTTGLSIGGALRLGPGGYVGSLAAITQRTGIASSTTQGMMRNGVVGTGGVDDPRMVTAMVVVAAVWMAMGIMVSTAILMNDGLVASYFASPSSRSSASGGFFWRRSRGRSGRRPRRGQGRTPSRRRRSRIRSGQEISPSLAAAVSSGSPTLQSHQQPPPRRPFLRWRGLGFGSRGSRNVAASGSPTSPPSHAGMVSSSPGVPTRRSSNNSMRNAVHRSGTPSPAMHPSVVDIAEGLPSSPHLVFPANSPQSRPSSWPIPILAPSPHVLGPLERPAISPRTSPYFGIQPSSFSTTAVTGGGFQPRRVSGASGYGTWEENDFEPLPGPALSSPPLMPIHSGTAFGFTYPLQDSSDGEDGFALDADDYDDDDLVIPLDIPGGFGPELGDEEDLDDDDEGESSEGFSEGDDVDFQLNLSPRLPPTLILEDIDEDQGGDGGEGDPLDLLDEDAFLIREEDHLLDQSSLPPTPFDGNEVLRSSSRAPSRAASPTRQDQAQGRRRMRFRLRRSVAPGTLAAIGAFLLLGVLWVLRRRGWALLPKLWQLAGRRWGAEL